MPTRALTDLTPQEFENLTYDLLQKTGFYETVWRTPGPDGGRDIEAFFQFTDASGASERQRWYVECKRYAASVDWPTVYGKLAYAVNQNADYLLMVSTANPSPPCETEIKAWNACSRPRIRFWRGYQIEGILRQNIQIGIKYGLIQHQAASAISLQPLALLSTKLAQSAQGAITVGRDPSTALEAAAAVGELMQVRTEEIDHWGQAIFDAKNLQRLPGWAAGASLPDFDDVGLMAYLAYFRHATACETVSILPAEASMTLTAVSPRLPLSRSALAALADVALWANLEQALVSPEAITVTQRS